MKKLVFFVSTVVLVGLLSIGVIYAYQRSKPSVEPQNTSQSVSTVEPPKPPTISELLALTNAERTKKGLKPYANEALLNKSAQLKAEDMTKYDYFAHMNPTTGKHGYTYVIDVGDSCIYQSENIAWHSASFNNSTEVLKTWMSSKPHREAILDPRYETIGFGISGQNVVAHFCDKG